MSRGFRDGMREENLRPPNSDDNTFKPTFGDLIKLLEIPGVLTDSELLWYRDQVRALIGLPPYPTDTEPDPDTPLNYDPDAVG